MASFEMMASGPDTYPAHDLSIVVPVYNEVDGISAVLENLNASFPDAEIIVVDDASNDGTSEALKAFSFVTVHRHAFNRGYGAALKTGMKQSTREYVGWFDADNEHRTEDLADMVRIIRERQLAAVIGERRNPAPSVMRTVGKSMMRLVGRLLGSQSVKDINCGLRVMHRDAIIRYLPILPNKFSASTTSTMILMERGYPITFHPISLNERIGTSKVVLSDGFSALLTIIRIVLLVAPMRIFFTAGIVTMFAGLCYGVVKLFGLGGSFPTSAFVLIVLGTFFCVLGLIADQISQSRLSFLDSLTQTDPRGRIQ